MDNLNITTININGFKSKTKQDYIKKFIQQNNIDILCMQETFIDNSFLSKKLIMNLIFQKLYGHTDQVVVRELL